MSPSYCLRYLAACFLVLRDRYSYEQLRSWAMDFELGGPDERALVVEALRRIVDRFHDREREGEVTKSARRHAGIWVRALREAESCYQPPPRGAVPSEPMRPRGPFFCGVWTDDGTRYLPVQHGAEPAKVITFEGPKRVAECVASAVRKPTSLDLEFSDQPPGVFGANKRRVPVVRFDGERLALPGEPQDLVEALAAIIGAPRVCGPYTIRGRACLGDPTGGALFGEHMTREAMLAWLDAREDEGTFEIIDESDGIEACGYDTGTCGGPFACDCGRSDCPDTEAAQPGDA